MASAEAIKKYALLFDVYLEATWTYVDRDVCVNFVT